MNCSKLLSCREKNESSLINHAFAVPRQGRANISVHKRRHTSPRRYICSPAHSSWDTEAQHTEVCTLRALKKWFTSQVDEWGIHTLCSIGKMKTFSWKRSTPHMVKYKQFSLMDQKRNSEIYNLCHPSSRSSISRWNSGAQKSSWPDLLQPPSGVSSLIQTLRYQHFLKKSRYVYTRID